MDRSAAADAVDALIEAELLFRDSRRGSCTRSSSRRCTTRSRRPSGRSSIWPPRASWRATRRFERVAAHLLAAGPAGPVGERWAFDALRPRRAGPATAALRTRRCDSCAGRSRRRRRHRCGGRCCSTSGAAESAARLPEAAGRMEEAQRLSSTPAERGQAALGLSMVRFLAAELPERSPPARTLLGADGRSRPGAASGARVPGRRDPAGRRASERRDVRAAAGARARGEPRRDGGGAQPAGPDRARVRRHHRPHRVEVAGSPRRRGGMGSCWSRSAPSIPLSRRPRRRSR